MTAQRNEDTRQPPAKYESQDETRRFLRALWPAPIGEIVLWSKTTTGRNFSTWTTVDHAHEHLPTVEDRDIYFSVCSQRWDLALAEAARLGKRPLQAQIRGYAKSAVAVPAVWLDVDCSEGDHSSNTLPTMDAAIAFLDAMDPQPSAIVHSGGGYHAYWFLKEVLALNDDNRAEAERLISAFQNYVRAQFSERGWTLDSTADLARILRVPGTLNHKTDPSRPVQLMKCDASVRYDINEIASFAKQKDLDTLADLTVGPGHAHEGSPEDAADPETIFDGCAWARHCRDDAEHLSEPEWFALLSIASHCKGGEALAHELSRPYPNYNAEETNAKFRRAKRSYGPRTCSSIQESFDGTHCVDCPYHGKVKSPIVLGRPGSLPHARKVVRETLSRLSSEDWKPAFESDLMRAVFTVRSADAHGFVQIREQLREAKVPLGEWDKAAKRQRRAGPQARTPAARRLPRIDRNGRQLRELFDDATKALLEFNARELRVFRFGSVLSTIQVVGGGVHLIPVTPTMLFGWLTLAANWFHVTDECEIPTKPDKDVAAELVESPSSDFPEIRGIAHAPLLDSTGRLVCAPGYDPKTDMYLHTGEVSDISAPKQPTVREIAAARELIQSELLGDFRFASLSDRANYVAALIAPLVRPIFRGLIPLHSIEAPIPGSGKGLLANIVGIVVRGRVPSTQSLARDDDEMRKRITAALLEGPEIICLDNAPERRELNSAALASVLTSESVTDRILGQTRMVTVPNRTVWLLTANNPRFSMEIARRTIRVRIDPGRDRPWLRQDFRHPNILEWTRQNRTCLLSALLTICRHWIAEGQPEGDITLGSFEPWSRTVGGILKTAGIDGFLQNLSDLYDIADEDGADWHRLVELWSNAHGTNGVRANQLAKICAENELLGRTLRDGSDRSQATRLGRALSQRRDRVIAGYQLRVLSGGKNGTVYQLTLTAAQSKGNVGEHAGTSEPEGSQEVNHFDTKSYDSTGNVGNVDANLHRESEKDSGEGAGWASHSDLFPADQKQVPHVPHGTVSAYENAPCDGEPVAGQHPRRFPEVPPKSTEGANDDGLADLRDIVGADS